MLQYSVYSVISPEGCASILWKTAERAPTRPSAGHHRPPPEGAGRDRQDRQRARGRRAPRPKQMAAQLKRALNDALRQVADLKPKELLQRRYERLQSYGR
jgi:acetyl-CoA carboxylase carboxyl transferase subunit alpha